MSTESKHLILYVSCIAIYKVATGFDDMVYIHI
jgi:hypothetical protein